MAKQTRKKPPISKESIEPEVIVLTKTGKPRQPWHLNGNSSARGTGFDKRPENAGAKKKIYTILKEKGYGKTDITTAFGELAFYSMNELKTAKKNARLPIITRIVANQFICAFDDNDWSKIKEIMEHTIGKPLQAIHQVNENIDISFED